MILPTIKLNIERWKYNPHFELYVSNMGHIKNRSKADIAPKITPGGYMVVFVHGSINRYMLLHRVVMLTWKPTPESEYLTVDHLDHNKRNNALSNLEWVSYEENLTRAHEDYLEDIQIVGNEVIYRKKKQPKPLDQRVGKRVVESVEFVRTCDGSGFTITDPSEIAEKIAPYVGHVNNFSDKGVRKIVKDMFSCKICNGYKKWCGFEIHAHYVGETVN